MAASIAGLSADGASREERRGLGNTFHRVPPVHSERTWSVFAPQLMLNRGGVVAASIAGLSADEAGCEERRGL